jgi:hypothetical protein
MFENLVGSSWHVIGGVTASLINSAAPNDPDTVVQGPGTISMASYWTHAESCAAARDRSVAKASYAEIQVAITFGIAALEGYLAHRVAIWNREHAEEALHEPSGARQSFEQRIKAWVPAMTGGRQLDRSKRNWQDYLRLKDVRDNIAIHPKASGHGASYALLVKLLNQLRTGIFGVLVDLHILFGERIPRVIIRGLYTPEVVLSEDN